MYGRPTRIDHLDATAPAIHPFGLWPIDDVSLAFSLGIRAKTLWWITISNTVQSARGGHGMYKSFAIPKPNGEKREIHEPVPVLKNVQKSVLVTYLNPIPVGPWVGAYVPRRPMLDSVRRHVGAKVKVSLDIANFFGTTRRGWVRQFWLAQGMDPDVVKLLSGLMVVPLQRGSEVVSVLPQGAPTSGAMANLVAQERLDKPLMDALHAVGTRWAYTRYSDNIEISFFDDLPRDEVDEVIKIAKDAIWDAGWKWREDKTQVQRHNSPKVGMRMLGFTINEKVNIPKQEYRRLRAIVHNCVTSGPDTQFKRYGADSAPQMLSSLKGKLIYWKQVAPWKMQPLLDKLAPLNP